VLSDYYQEDNSMSLLLNSIFQREKRSNKDILFPISYSEKPFNFSQFPKKLTERMFLDLSFYNFEETVKSTKTRAQFGMEIAQLSHIIARSLNQKTHKTEIVKDTNEKYEQDERVEELLLLANEYDKLRKEMSSGNNRTLLMEKIVKSMKSAMNNPLSDLDKWTKSKSAGQRLLAIAKLQKYPNLDYLSWLADHVGYSEKPFIGYHSSVAIFIFSRFFGKREKDLLENAINKARLNIERSEYKDPNQVSVLDASLKELL
jgi:hypothetical protein